jgi:hypothetical protein
MGFFDFLNNEKKAVGNFFNFLGKNTVARTVASSFNPLAQLTSKPVRDIAVSVARSTARVPETVARSVQAANPAVQGAYLAQQRLQQKLENDKKLQERAKNDPALKKKLDLAKSLSNNPVTNLTVGKDSGAVNDPLRRFAYGSDPVQTYQSRGEGISKDLQSGNNPLHKKVNPVLAVPLAIAGTGLNAAFDLPGGGTLEKLGKGAVEQLAKETTEQGVKKLLAEKVGVEIADKVALAVSRTKDPGTIVKIIDNARTPIQQVTKDIARNAPPAPRPGQDIVAATVPKTPSLPRPEIPPATPLTPVTQATQAVGKGSAPKNILDATIPKTAENITPPKADAFQEISDVLNGKSAAAGQAPVKGLKTVSAKSKTALQEQRGARFGASQAQAATARGSEGYFREIRALKGSYDRPQIGGMIDNLGPEKAEDLFSRARQQVLDVPDSTYKAMGLHAQAARLNTQTALRKVIFGEGGGVPTPSEIKLLETVSPKMAADIKATIPKHRALFDLAAKIAGVPRAAKSTLDISMGGRQGLLVAGRHPVEWARANVESLKYLKDQKYFEKSMNVIRNSSEYESAAKYKLALQAAAPEKLTEEAFASSDILTGKVAKKLVVGHLVDASERAYDGGLTTLRYNLWKNKLDSLGGLEKAQRDLGDQGMKDLAEVINTATGRGGKAGGLVEKHMKSLSTTLFSPRLWASRLNTLNPYYYYRLSPVARREALENAGAFAGLATLALTAAAAAGGQVETDPRSSDFLKVKFGDSRYDILGGLQQNIVFAAREITGSKKSSQSGRITKLGGGFGSPTRLSVAADLVRNKANPFLGAAANILEGTDKSGNKVNPLTEIGQLFVPLSIQGTVEGYKSSGIGGALKNIPDVVGISTQTYGIKDINPTNKQKEYLDYIKKQGAAPDIIDANKAFFQYLKTGPDKQSASSEINDALANNDVQKAQQIAQDYNKALLDTIKPWNEKYGKYASADLQNLFNQSKINLDASSIRERQKSNQPGRL